MCSEGDKRVQRTKGTGGRVLWHWRELQVLWLPYSAQTQAIKDVSADTRRKDFREPDPPNIDVIKALGEDPYADSDPQQQSVCLTRSIKFRAAGHPELGLHKR